MSRCKACNKIMTSGDYYHPLCSTEEELCSSCRSAAETAEFPREYVHGEAVDDCFFEED